MHSKAVAVAAVSALAVAAGAGNSLVSRILQSVNCDKECSPDAKPHFFAKPLFVTAVAFAAMATSLLVPVAVIIGQVLFRITNDCTNGKDERARREEALMQKLLFEGDVEMFSTPARIKDVNLIAEAPRPTWIGCCTRYGVLAVPTVLDVIATALQSAAVLFVTAGVNASMRGSLLLFTAVGARFSGSYEGQASNTEWLGILISSVGSSLAGVATILNGGTSDGSGGLLVIDGWSAGATAALGLGLSLASNAVQGVQVAIETRLLQGRVFSASETNGVEGVMGVALLVAVLAILQVSPGGQDNGHVEDSFDTLCCLSSSPDIAILSGILAVMFALSTGAYMTLSSLRGGNYRALLMVGRSLLVWLAELGLFYWGSQSAGTSGVGDLSSYGQPFRSFDWLQAAGFGLLVVGGVVTWRAQTAREKASGGPSSLFDDLGSTGRLSAFGMTIGSVPGSATSDGTNGGPRLHMAALYPGEDTLAWGMDSGILADAADR